MLVHLVGATEHGDVEQVTVGLARPVVVAVGLVAFEVDLEVAAHFATFSHLKALVKGRIHGESILDVDNAVVLFFHQFVFSDGFGVVVVEVGPVRRHAIGPQVHCGVVGVRLFWIFSRFLLHHAHVAGLNRCHQQCNHYQAEKGLASHG